eukprot:UC4_evm1s1236
MTFSADSTSAVMVAAIMLVARAQSAEASSTYYYCREQCVITGYSTYGPQAFENPNMFGQCSQAYYVDIFPSQPTTFELCSDVAEATCQAACDGVKGIASANYNGATYKCYEAPTKPTAGPFGVSQGDDGTSYVWIFPGILRVLAERNNAASAVNSIGFYSSVDLEEADVTEFCDFNDFSLSLAESRKVTLGMIKSGGQTFSFASISAPRIAASIDSQGSDSFSIVHPSKWNSIVDFPEGDAEAKYIFQRTYQCDTSQIHEIEEDLICPYTLGCLSNSNQALCEGRDCVPCTDEDIAAKCYEQASQGTLIESCDGYCGICDVPTPSPTASPTAEPTIALCTDAQIEKEKNTKKGAFSCKTHEILWNSGPMDIANYCQQYDFVPGNLSSGKVIDVCASFCQTCVTPSPTANPTLSFSTKEPTLNPTKEPTLDPTKEPTLNPTKEPTPNPTKEPTFNPTKEPTASPSVKPTAIPTSQPSSDPTDVPTYIPSLTPTSSPSNSPTTPVPSGSPTTPQPSLSPTIFPTGSPTRRLCEEKDYIAEEYNAFICLGLTYRFNDADRNSACGIDEFSRQCPR